MTILANELGVAAAQNVVLSEDTLKVELADGRTIEVPLAWYARLQHGSPVERNRWRLIGKGEGIHWPNLDEDISVENVLQGKPSGESQDSLRRWLKGRRKRHTRQ